MIELFVFIGIIVFILSVDCIYHLQKEKQDMEKLNKLNMRKHTIESIV